jgi:predicted metal-binding protein
MFSQLLQVFDEQKQVFKINGGCDSKYSRMSEFRPSVSNFEDFHPILVMIEEIMIAKNTRQTLNSLLTTQRHSLSATTELLEAFLFFFWQGDASESTS